MPDLSGSKTHENLVAAFARESQNGVRYQWFAQAADIDGQPATAALFRSIADAEIGHAYAVLEHLVGIGDPVDGGPIGDTAEHLAAAIAGETGDAEELYPRCAATARAEGFGEIAEWFETLAQAERRQAERFRSALDSSG